ncbi:glucocorticoid receptor-like (DNA-binding domain) [Rozella allomycis CSF55]|uniref:Glucocorticoid receptor-like (DNA-binding domain) n=1 Tax=Rozella allomycis (strain CSF55) TaxID=988480 RepID=A0A4P9YFT0_ROZAC|nr:glucocorticoid receptor-like (DNA-binding domain) [Rozella allomycis CSF55]
MDSLSTAALTLRSQSPVTQTQDSEKVVLCANCFTESTPLWRRGLMGEHLCNACGLYVRNHKKQRPISRADSKQRNRTRKSEDEKIFLSTPDRISHLQHPPVQHQPRPISFTRNSFQDILEVGDCVVIKDWFAPDKTYFVMIREVLPPNKSCAKFTWMRLKETSKHKPELQLRDTDFIFGPDDELFIPLHLVLRLLPFKGPIYNSQ